MGIYTKAMKARNYVNKYFNTIIPFLNDETTADFIKVTKDDKEHTVICLRTRTSEHRTRLFLFDIGTCADKWMFTKMEVLEKCNIKGIYVNTSEKASKFKKFKKLNQDELLEKALEEAAKKHHHHKHHDDDKHHGKHHHHHKHDKKEKTEEKAVEKVDSSEDLAYDAACNAIREAGFVVK